MTFSHTVQSFGFGVWLVVSKSDLQCFMKNCEIWCFLLAFIMSVLCVSLVSPQKKVDTPKDSLENERAPSFPLPPMKKDMTFQGVKTL